MVILTQLPQRQRRVKTVVVEQPVVVRPTGKTLRNRRRRARARTAVRMEQSSNPLAVGMNNAPYNSMNTVGGSISTQFAIPPSKSMGVQGYTGSTKDLRSMAMAKMAAKNISSDGMKFLKCAFAPPDFAGSDIKGVPDDYGGPSLTKKHRFIGASFNPPTTDTWILLLPTPGVAYWTFNTVAGASVAANQVLTPVFYADAANMFPTNPNSTSIINSFRYVSNHIELVPTSNATQWAGSITSWKLPISVIQRTGLTTLGDGLLTVTGLQGLNGTNVNMYSGPICNGIYSGAYSSDSSFRFSPVYDGSTAVPFVVQASDFGQLASGTPVGGSPLGVVGFDNSFECIVVKVSNYSASLVNNFLTKTYTCVEYKCSPGSSLKEYETLSPTRDEAAMMLYKEIIRELPVGVHFMDNDTFWQRVLDIIARLGAVGSVVPGPYGAISGGVGSIASAIRQLTS